MLSPVLHVPAPTLVVSITPSFASKDSTTTTGNFTDTLTAVVSGGLAPYTYSWTKSNEDGDGTINIASPTSSNTNLTYLGLTYLSSYASCTITLQVTDVLGTSKTFNASAFVSRISGGGSPP